MSDPSKLNLTFHKNTFFELTTDRYTLFVDPVFSRERRGRRVADEIRDCDYLFVTSTTPWFDDALDVLDEGEATLVAAPRVTRYISQELGLRRRRLLDLEPWERASESGFRVTALPIWASIGMERSIRESASILKDISNVFPNGSERLPFGRNARNMIDGGLKSLTNMVGSLANLTGQSRALDNVGSTFNVDLGRFTGGRPGLGFLFEFDGFHSLMHLADGVHAAISDEDLEDIADVCEPDVLLLHIGGREIDPVVRAVRTLNPRTVLLYRSRDPYTAGRRGQTRPLGHFIDAIEEDAPRTEVVQLRKGDSFLIKRSDSKETISAAKSAEGSGSGKLSGLNLPKSSSSAASSPKS